MTDTTIWLSLCAEAEFPEDGKLAKQLGGWSVLVVRSEDGFSAVNDRCTHQAALLSPGRVRRGAMNTQFPLPRSALARCRLPLEVKPPQGHTRGLVGAKLSFHLLNFNNCLLLDLLMAISSHT